MKIPKPDKPKKKPRKYLRQRRKRSPKDILFDKVWKKCSEYVRKRDNYICFTCDRQLDKDTSHAGHFRHGKTKPTFFDERQIRCQCVKCNKWLSGNLGIYGVKLSWLLGKKTINEIIQSSFQLKIWKAKELEKLDRYFDEKLKEL